MSETTNETSTATTDQHPPPVEHDPAAVDAAVAESLSKAAPPDAENQRMAMLETQVGALAGQVGSLVTLPTGISDRLDQVDGFIRRFQPVLEMAETMLAAEAPGLSPVINRVSALESWAAQLIDHFQHKVPPVPTGS